MSLLQAQQMGNVANAPQRASTTLGPNRYIPPTFDWGRGGLDGNQRQRTQMNWNQMQDYYLPNQGGQRPGPNQYGDALRQMLEQFGGQYGGAGRRPQLPQFGSYDPGFGGPTSYYDQQQQQQRGRGGGRMPQFNPFQLMQSNIRGMSMDQMFPEGWAQLFGGQGFGQLTPNPRPMPILPDLAAGNKPYPVGG